MLIFSFICCFPRTINYFRTMKNALRKQLNVKPSQLSERKIPADWWKSRKKNTLMRGKNRWEFFSQFLRPRCTKVKYWTNSRGKNVTRDGLRNWNQFVTSRALLFRTCEFYKSTLNRPNRCHWWDRVRRKRTRHGSKSMSWRFNVP